eukprot:1137841-Pelagomonas_calceolata.AAC.12
MRVALQEQLQILNPLGCCEFAWSLMPAFHIHKWGVFMFDWLQAFLEEKAAKAAAAKAESERARIEIEERAYAQAVAHERKMAGIRERDMAHGQQIKEQMAVRDCMAFLACSTRRNLNMLLKAGATISN